MNKKLFEYSYTLRKQKQSKNIKILCAVVISLIVISIVMNFLIYPVTQNSKSMSPDIPDGTTLVVTPIVKNPDRGDVIILKPERSVNYTFFKKVANSFVVFFTARQLSLIEDDKFPNTKPKLRRVVGIPGDTIYMKDYKIYVKPKNQKHFLTEYELSSISYNINYGNSPENWDDLIGISGNFESIVLGNDEYFVLADDRNSSEDSRIWGPIKQEKIDGKVLLSIFPFKNARKFF